MWKVKVKDDDTGKLRADNANENLKIHKKLQKDWWLNQFTIPNVNENQLNIFQTDTTGYFVRNYIKISFSSNFLCLVYCFQQNLLLIIELFKI